MKRIVLGAALLGFGCGKSDAPSSQGAEPAIPSLTAPKPTGNAGADANIKLLVEWRDATCACKDRQCATRAESIVGAAPMPADAPQVALDYSRVLLAETLRCLKRLPAPMDATTTGAPPNDSL